MAIGEILVGIHALKPEFLDRALSIQRAEIKNGRCSKIGEILLKRRYITPSELQTALILQRTGKNIYGF